MTPARLTESDAQTVYTPPMLEVGAPPPTTAPTYTTRLLPPEEWDRLRALPFATNGLPDPQTAFILITEDAGQIIGVWACFLQPMLDGLWTDPTQRHAGLVAHQLLREMTALLQGHGIQCAFTLISDPAVMVLAHKAGFVRAPGDLWILQLQPSALPEEA